MAKLPNRVRWYALAIAFGGALALPAWIAVWPDQCCFTAPEAVALPAGFAVLIAIALLFPLRLSAYYLLTVDSAAAFAALLLFGPVPAMAATGLGAAAANLVQAARGKRDRWNVLFNVGKNMLLVGLAAIPIFGLAGLHAPLALDRLPSAMAAISGALVFDVCNTLAVAIAVGLQHGRSPLPIWRESRRVSATHSQVLLLVGLLTALLTPARPWAVGLLVLLMGLVYRSLRQTLRLLDLERIAREAAESQARARGEFLGLAAHELRTPITSLRGYAQGLVRRMEGGHSIEAPRARRALEVIDRQSDKLARLVTQLLDVSRVQAGTLTLDYRSTDVVALAAEVAAAAQETATNPLIVNAPNPVIATVDSLRLEQVIVNLVENAIKYNVDHMSPIEIDVLQLTTTTVQVAVRDHGLGVPEADREHVFERFYQAGGSRMVGGMGLGLYISRQIVEAHDGIIELESPPDGGARFVVTLPSFPAPDRRDALADAAAPHHPANATVAA
jgi:signal transduction histidine kinase